MKDRQNLNKNELRLDRGLGFVTMKIVNPTAFLRFRGRRQFSFL